MSDSSEDVLALLRSAPPGSMTAAQYMTLARDLAGQQDLLQPLRLVFLSTFTTTLFDPFLKVEAARHGFALDVFHGGFGQFEQVMLQDDWLPEDDRPVALTIAMRLEDLDPELSYRFYDPERQPFSALADDVLERVENTMGLFHRKAQGPVLIANFAPPSHRPLSVFEANNPDSLTASIHELNKAMLSRISATAGAFIWDYAGLMAAHGADHWTDLRLWSLARTAVASAYQPFLAAHLMRTLQGVLRPAAKCLVLDLDNTLWGGVIGDDGPGGIVIGDDYPGNAFKQFQRAVLGLRDRGIVLAVCSKNDPEVVEEVFDSHPDMLLRSEHIAAQRINWLPKSGNLKEIARELNIGLDSLVFFDDNPVERAEVRSALPEVIVVEVPADPVLYASALTAVAEFDIPALTDEDRGRADSYQAQLERRKSEEQSGSLEDFLHSLDMQVEIGSLDETSAQRIAQLVNKTNQFNLTTRRRSQSEIEEISEKEDAEVYWLRLKDRYGDMGLIAVAIVEAQGKDLHIDSLILSCRAANRGMEQTMLAHVAELAARKGYERLLGEYVATARNHVVADLYPALGFEVLSRSEEGGNFALNLGSASLAYPDFINLSQSRAA